MSCILVLGNSHTGALKEAGPVCAGTQILWVNTKPGRVPGDIGVDEALARSAELGPEDCLILMRLGSLHNIIGLLNHDIAFALVHALDPGEAVEVIPEAVMRELMAEHAASDKFLRKVAAHARCRVGHIMTPPPKKNLDSTSRTFSAYRGRRIADVGFSPAPHRLALWWLEKSVLDAFLPTIGIVPIAPPPETVTGEGYLDPAYAAPDATHANGAYGARLMARIRAFAAEPAPLLERS
ncbi:MAG: hypothetical protein AAF913_00160 [Pseudomonadota bacterium]